MIPGLKPVPLIELKSLSSAKIWSIDGHLDQMPSLTPIRGEISAKHLGNKLKLTGKIHTIVNLHCDRCLNQFNQKLIFDSEELICISPSGKESPPSRRTNDIYDRDCLLEYLSPFESFDPESWIFEQLSLQMPMLKICGDDCPGPSKLQTPLPKTNQNSHSQFSGSMDPRWEVLKKLRPL